MSVWHDDPALLDDVRRMLVRSLGLDLTDEAIVSQLPASLLEQMAEIGPEDEVLRDRACNLFSMELLDEPWVSTVLRRTSCDIGVEVNRDLGWFYDRLAAAARRGWLHTPLSRGGLRRGVSRHLGPRRRARKRTA